MSWTLMAHRHTCNRPRVALFLLAIVVFAAWPREAHAETITITSTVMQSGFNSTIGGGNVVITGAGTGYDFAGEPSPHWSQSRPYRSYSDAV